MVSRREADGAGPERHGHQRIIFAFYSPAVYGTSEYSPQLTAADVFGPDRRTGSGDSAGNRKLGLPFVADPRLSRWLSLTGES
jgi:hypothetical protein